MTLDNENFEVRAFHEKTRFYTDDDFIDNYLRLIGPTAGMIYEVLARHSSVEQKCFPSTKLIAKKIRASKRTVLRELEKLESYRFIKIERRRGDENVYYLLHRKHWLKTPIMRQRPTSIPSVTSSPDVTSSQNVTTQEPKELSTTGIPDVTTTGDILDRQPVSEMSPGVVTSCGTPIKNGCILRVIKKNGKYRRLKSPLTQRKLKTQQHQLAKFLNGLEKELYENPQIIEDLVGMGYERVRILAALETAKTRVKPVSYFIKIVGDPRFALSNKSMDKAKQQMGAVVPVEALSNLVLDLSMRLGAGPGRDRGQANA